MGIADPVEAVFDMACIVPHEAYAQMMSPIDDQRSLIERRRTMLFEMLLQA
jgi:hypothetical protein